MKLYQPLIILVLALLLSQSFAQQLPAQVGLNLTEMEVMELNLSREIVMANRFEVNVIAESEQADFLQIMTEQLNELGWVVGWQDIKNMQDNWMVSDFYRIGGQHLRLELSEVSPNNYRMLLYRF